MCANTFCALQYDFVCVQTHFTSLQQLIRRSEWPLHHCNNAFGGQNGRYIVAATDLGVRMAITSLQQLIRRAEWAFTSLQQLIRGPEWAFFKGLRVGKDHFHVFGTHAVQQSAYLLLGILLCELQVLA